jgi:hypothetical protein
MAREGEEEQMAERPFWSGQFKISLVSFGIQIFPATSAQAGISFHQIDRVSGERVPHQNVIDEDQPVDKSNIVKGYEYSRGKYVIVEPEEIDKLRISTKNTIDIRQFVDLAELPLALFEKPYFVVPAPKESLETFAVVRKAGESGTEKPYLSRLPAQWLRGYIGCSVFFPSAQRSASRHTSQLEKTEKPHPARIPCDGFCEIDETDRSGSIENNAEGPAKPGR